MNSILLISFIVTFVNFSIILFLFPKKQMSTIERKKYRHNKMKMISFFHFTEVLETLKKLYYLYFINCIINCVKFY